MVNLGSFKDTFTTHDTFIVNFATPVNMLWFVSILLSGIGIATAKWMIYKDGYYNLFFICRTERVILENIVASPICTTIGLYKDKSDVYSTFILQGKMMFDVFYRTDY